MSEIEVMVSPLCVCDVNILERILGVTSLCFGREYLAGNFRCPRSVFGT